MKKTTALFLALVLVLSILPIGGALAASYSSPITFAQKEYGATVVPTSEIAKSYDYIYIDISADFLYDDDLMIGCSWGGKGYSIFVPFDDALLFATDVVSDFAWDAGWFMVQGSSEQFTFGLKESNNTRQEVANLIYLVYLCSL